MRRPIAMTVSVMILGVTAGCGRSAAPISAPDLAVPTSHPPAVADVVDVDCSSAGTKISATQFAAQRDGVHIRVQNTSGAPDVYLNYRSHPRGDLSGGDPVESGTVLVLGLAPGRIYLNCSYDDGSKQDRSVAIEVLDPAQAWQTGELATLDCSPPAESVVDWVYRPGYGTTVDVALAALAAQLDPPVTWRHVQEGYVAAARQTYVVMRADKPWATASVDRSAAGRYRAYLESPCSADKASPTS